jgi:hypothetical protein
MGTSSCVLILPLRPHVHAFVRIAFVRANEVDALLRPARLVRDDDLAGAAGGDRLGEMDMQLAVARLVFQLFM